MEVDWTLLCLLTALLAVLCLADGQELHGCGDGSVDPWHDPRGSITYLGYRNNAYCQCSIAALPSESVHLHVSYLDVEPSLHCKFDRLMLKLARQSVHYLCGRGVDGGTHVEARGHVLIIFQSDESEQYGGFVLHYEVTLDRCRRLKPCRHGARCENLQTTFRCHCRPGWAGPSCQHGIARVQVAFRLNLQKSFQKVLSRVGSPEHDSLALACRELIEPFFWNVSGFQEVIVTGIRSGSVIVDCEAVFSAGPVRNLLHDMPKLLWESGLPRAVSAGLTIAGSRVTNLILTGTRPILCGTVFTCEPGFKCLKQLGKPVCRSLCHLGLCQHEGVCSHPSGDLPSCRCPVGEDFWFVGSRCNERRTNQSVSLTGVVLGAIFAVIAMATVTVTTLLLRARQRRHRHSSRAGDVECAESSYRRFSRCDEISAPSRHSSWLSALSSDSQCGSDVTVGAPGHHTNAPSALGDIWVPLTDQDNGRCSCRLDTSQDFEGNLLGSNPVSQLVSARGCPIASSPQYSPVYSKPLHKVERGTVQAFQEDLHMAEFRISTWREQHLRSEAYDHRNEGPRILKAFDDGDSSHVEAPRDGRFTGRLTNMCV